MGRLKDSCGVPVNEGRALSDGCGDGKYSRSGGGRRGGPPCLPGDIGAPASLLGLFFVGLFLHVLGSNALLQWWVTGCPHLLEGFSNKWIKPDSWPAGGIIT